MASAKTILSLVALAALGLGDATTNVAEAGMFDMMNPSRWFNNNNRGDYYDRGYYRGYGPYGYGGSPYGYGGGPWGYGGGPWGYGGGYPGYYGGYPYGGGQTQQAKPKIPE